MPKQMIESLQPGEPVDSVFLVVESSLRTTRAGSNYLTVKLADRTGRLDGKLWDASEAVAGAIAPDDFVQVKGKAESYRNEIQINIRSITKADTDSLRLREFLKESERDPEEMMQEMVGLLAQVEDPDYRALLDAFLQDEELCKGFRTAPAAMRNHHAYLGGLLEHTLSMMHLALKIMEHYTTLRRDVLLTGVFLHDVGKVQELACKRSFSMTLPGQLVGHIVLGVLMLEEKARTLDAFPEEKLNMMRHLILSHHGQREYGSPKLPMFAEAIALHYVDNLDAKLKEFDEAIAEDKNADPHLTDYARLFETRLYKG